MFRKYIGEWLSRFSSGLFPHLVRVDCAGDVAVFEVTNQTEQWRASHLGGEEEVIASFLDHVSKDDIVWDIGANIGVYSIFAARAGSTVYAFEPDSGFANHLEENIKLNNVGDEISVERVALSDENGTENLYTDGTNGVSPTLAESSNREAIEVVTKRGTDVDAEPPDYIKIDVEGGEVQTLTGLSEYLAEASGVLIEVHPSRIEEFGDDPDDVFNILSEAGLEETYSYEREGQKLFFFSQ